MSSPTSQQPACPSARERLWRGVRLGFPIFLGYVPVGAAFGILARSWGFTSAQAVTCSATALAGAGQFIGLSLMYGGASIATVLLATTVVNLRYVLFGATLSPYLRGNAMPTQLWLAFSLTDETFAVNIDDNRRGLADAASMAGVGIVAWTGWVLGTGLGALGGSAIGDPTRWGVDFAMPAMFTALLVAQIEGRRHLAVAALAAVLAVGFMLVLPGKWYIIAASIVAAFVGAVAER